eukprot:1157314-Pelagomonas_calceolata.AAC.1
MRVAIAPGCFIAESILLCYCRPGLEGELHEGEGELCQWISEHPVCRAMLMCWRGSRVMSDELPLVRDS